MLENMGRQLFTLEAAGKSFGPTMIKFDNCALWIVSELHPAGAFCPHCSASIIDGCRQARFYALEQIRCPSCKKKFTAATGTLLNNSKLDPREIYLLAVLTQLGVSPGKIAATLRSHVDTVSNWQAHFKAHQELAGA
jgi:transposase-like protein